MPMTWNEAVAALTGPGAPFEVVEADVRGQTTRVYKNTPPSLRALFDTARARGDATFLVYEDERWSFAETMARVDALGAALAARAVRPGDRVAIAMRNYPEWVVAFAAITSIGAISVSLNAWWTTEELDYALRDSGSRVVIADRERVDRIAPLLGGLTLGVIAVRSPGALPRSVERWEDAVLPGAALPAVPIEPDMDATILYTSGTTGYPKGAVSTQRAVLSALQSFACRAAMNAAMGVGARRASAHPTSFILVVP
ncbi:MAG: AMP-binding protein, partial [Myxococcota bacterium]